MIAPSKECRPSTTTPLKCHDEFGVAALSPVTAVILHLDELSEGVRKATFDRPIRAFR